MVSKNRHCNIDTLIFLNVCGKKCEQLQILDFNFIYISIGIHNVRDIQIPGFSLFIGLENIQIALNAGFKYFE